MSDELVKGIIAIMGLLVGGFTLRFFYQRKTKITKIQGDSVEGNQTTRNVVKGNSAGGDIAGGDIHKK